MTDDERPAGIRARAATHEVSHPQDVPWLLDRLAEVTAERDAYLDELTRVRAKHRKRFTEAFDQRRRAERAETALARVTALCDEQSEKLTVDGPNRYVAISKVRAALDGER